MLRKTKLEICVATTYENIPATHDEESVVLSTNDLFNCFIPLLAFKSLKRGRFS